MRSGHTSQSVVSARLLLHVLAATAEPEKVRPASHRGRVGFRHGPDSGRTSRRRHSVDFGQVDAPGASDNSPGPVAALNLEHGGNGAWIAVDI